MKLLQEISDKTVGLGEPEQLKQPYRLRKSARAILINEKGEMALQSVRRDGYHKLPGGGLKEGEAVESALAREILEEVGCRCQVVSTIGLTIEYRNQHSLLQISYCYVAEVVGEPLATTLDSDELAAQQETVWVTPATARSLFETDEPQTYEGKFIQSREIVFIKEFVNIWNQAI